MFFRQIVFWIIYKYNKYIYIYILLFNDPLHLHKICWFDLSFLVIANIFPFNCFFRFVVFISHTLLYNSHDFFFTDLLTMVFLFLFAQINVECLFFIINVCFIFLLFDCCVMQIFEVEWTSFLVYLWFNSVIID